MKGHVEMRLEAVAFLMVVTSMPALAQTSPGFVDGATLCANYPNAACASDPNPNPLSLNQAFMNKQDVSPVIGTSTGFTIDALPSCGISLMGARAYVTNGQSLPPFMGTVFTTGATIAPVFCDGTSWLYG